MRRMKNVVVSILIFILLSAQQGMAQKKYALLVGISDYHSVYKDSEWNNIHGVNDVNLVASILSKQKFQVDKVLNGSATKSNILKHLKTIIRHVSKGAVVYLHFSCHGQPFEDFNGDEADGWDESIVPVDAPISYVKGQYEGKHHITDDELNKYTEQLRFKIGPSGYLYVIIDACHAGRASRDLDEIEITRGTKRGFSPSGKRYKAKREIATHYKLSRSAAESNVTYLEACGNTQVNIEVKKNGTYYGPLSYYISQILSKHILDTNNSWIYQVQQLMRKDIDAQNQDMVIESTK